MRFICTFLLATVSCMPAFADVTPRTVQSVPRELLVYVEPEVARMVIKKHFSNMSTDYLPTYTTRKSDDAILAEVIDEYGKILEKHNGHISNLGLRDLCNKAFSNLVPVEQRPYYEFATEMDLGIFSYRKCLVFTDDLLNTTIEQNSECDYTISQDNGSQMRIKYVSKTDGTGFVRKNGSLPWRFFNPGALRDSPYKCTRFDTKPNGKFAVFDDDMRGRYALRWVLQNAEKYDNKTVTQAIYAYAPPNENNTIRYVRMLQGQGVDVDKLLSDLDNSEWELLLDAISQIEGWNATGEIEEF